MKFRRMQLGRTETTNTAPRISSELSCVGVKTRISDLPLGRIAKEKEPREGFALDDLFWINTLRDRAGGECSLLLKLSAKEAVEGPARGRLKSCTSTDVVLLSFVGSHWTGAYAKSVDPDKRSRLRVLSPELCRKGGTLQQ